jgi:hypothetical protein
MAPKGKKKYKKFDMDERLVVPGQDETTSESPGPSDAELDDEIQGQISVPVHLAGDWVGLCVPVAAHSGTNSLHSSNNSSSEFPSLGAPAQQHNTAAAQSLWANSTIRAPSQQSLAGVQRAGVPPSNLAQPQDESTHFGPGTETYRFGANTNQLAGLAQTPSQGQGGTSEEFPPLGGLGGVDGDRRSSLLAGFGNSGLGVQSSRLGLDPTTELALRSGMSDRNVCYVRGSV